MPNFFCLSRFAVIQLGDNLENSLIAKVYKGYTGLPSYQWVG